MARFQRRTEPGTVRRATTLELFYDLVFVFAITQVSHLLIENLTWEGAGQAALTLLVIWWAWNYTTWVTNELDSESIAVRLVLIALMLASLLMAVAIPHAFDQHGLLFAVSYVAIQVGRHTFLTFVCADPGTIGRERAGRILVWLTAAGVFWIAGGIGTGSARVALWLVALGIDYAGPLALYWFPGRPRLSEGTWDVDTAHFSERFQLFVIIALGESIVITGATTAELDLDTLTLTAFAVAFLGTAALWWLYFNSIATLTERHLERAEDRTRVARDVYTYLHVLLVAGVIVMAVGDELVIAHPTEELPDAQLVAVVAGPTLYLLAQVALRLRNTGEVSPRRVGGVVGCLAVGFVGTFTSALVLAGLLLAVLVAVIAADHIAAARRGGWRLSAARG